MHTEKIDYERYSLKTYKYWTVYLHCSQIYLGRCYIALNRDGNIDPYLETTPEEKAELEIIIAEIHRALDALYQPDIYNYANFRNTWPKCHWHVIPRYNKYRKIDGQVFTDNNWDRNYAPYDKGFAISEKILNKILDDFSEKLAT